MTNVRHCVTVLGMPTKRPPKPPRPETITFRCVDAETLAALARIEAALGPGVVGARSAAIRRAILNEAARLDGGGRR